MPEIFAYFRDNKIATSLSSSSFYSNFCEIDLSSVQRSHDDNIFLRVKSYHNPFFLHNLHNNRMARLNLKEKGKWINTLQIIIQILSQANHNHEKGDSGGQLESRNYDI